MIFFPEFKVSVIFCSQVMQANVKSAVWKRHLRVLQMDANIRVENQREKL